MADETLDRLQRGDFLAVHEREGVADILRTTGAADAMHVIFGMLRHIVINDVTDTGDIETARGDVGCDHHFVLATLETFQRFDALALSAIRMQHRHGMLSLFQFVSDPVGPMFRSRKNQRAVKVSAFEKRHQEIELLFGRDRINRVGHGFSGRTANADFH